MNRRDAIKNTMMAMWPKSKLPTQTLSATIDRLNDSGLSLDQITALLNAHQQECEKAAWSPFPPDISRRVNAVRADVGNREHVAKTAKSNADDANYINFVNWSNGLQSDRVRSAVECMEMNEIDAFVKARVSGTRASMWEYAKSKLGPVETWTPERLAERQSSRCVLANVLGFAPPEYDRNRVYPQSVKRAGTDSVPSLAGIGSPQPSAPKGGA